MIAWISPGLRVRLIPFRIALPSMVAWRLSILSMAVSVTLARQALVEVVLHDLRSKAYPMVRAFEGVPNCKLPPRWILIVRRLGQRLFRGGHAGGPEVRAAAE